MTHDELQVLGLVLGFAAFATAHVALIAGLAGRKPRWRALVALPIAPLAPFWGARAGMHVRVVIWVASAAVYLALRVFAK